MMMSLMYNQITLTECDDFLPISARGHRICTAGLVKDPS